MGLIIDKGRRILALDENEVYIVTQDINIGDEKYSEKFDFLARKEVNGIVRGFSFKDENLKYSRL